MPGNVLIPVKNGRGVQTYGLNSNNTIRILTMRKTLICFLVSFAYHFYCVTAELEFYPGFRRPNPVLKWEKEQQTAEEYALEQLTNYLQEQQRRLELEREREPEFTFRVPVTAINPDDRDFAVAPPDPRYYQSSPDDYDFLETDSDPSEDLPVQQQQQPSQQSESTQKRQPDQTTVKDIKEPRIIVKTRTDDIHPASGLHHIREQDLSRFGSSGILAPSQSVDITPIKASIQDDTAGVYIIAVVAGISAAATVGLIAFAIGWYNLQKNVKNATDVEYPAYGVTGPNKDVSPTGDRRLAQSAQMYHYQHQKQQIIAMESRAGATVRHGSMSEAESDEENEEGDYTVYECPGLAPTGEMEVKNPLFQDDPTPASAQPAKEEDSLPDQK